MRRRLTEFAAAGLLAAAACSLPALAGKDAGAGTGAAGRGSEEGRLSTPDQRFVVGAALGGMMEVDLGRLAERQASRDAVRTFAQRMVRDHTQQSQELMSLASSKGVKLPRMMPGAAEKGDAEGAGGNARAGGQGDGGLRIPGGPAETRDGRGTEGMGMLDTLGLRHMAVHHQEERRLLSGMNGPMFDAAYMGNQVKAHAKALADFELHSRNSQDPEVRSFAARYVPALREHYRMARHTAGMGTETGGNASRGNGR